MSNTSFTNYGANSAVHENRYNASFTYALKGLVNNSEGGDALESQSPIEVNGSTYNSVKTGGANARTSSATVSFLGIVLNSEQMGELGKLKGELDLTIETIRTDEENREGTVVATTSIKGTIVQQYITVGVAVSNITLEDVSGDIKYTDSKDAEQVLPIGLEAK